MAEPTAHPERNPEVTVVQTLGAVLSDLVDIVGRMPVPADQVEQVATTLDRLSEEIAQAAGMLRQVPR